MERITYLPKNLLELLKEDILNGMNPIERIDYYSKINFENLCEYGDTNTKLYKLYKEDCEIAQPNKDEKALNPYVVYILIIALANGIDPLQAIHYLRDRSWGKVSSDEILNIGKEDYYYGYDPEEDEILPDNFWNE